MIADEIIHPVHVAGIEVTGLPDHILAKVNELLRQGKPLDARAYVAAARRQNLVTGRFKEKPAPDEPEPRPMVQVAPAAPSHSFVFRCAGKPLQVKTTIDPASLVRFRVPFTAAVPFEFVTKDGRMKLTGTFNLKSLRKAVAAVAEHGTDNVVAIVQGRLTGSGKLEDVGISVQVI